MCFSLQLVTVLLLFYRIEIVHVNQFFDDSDCNNDCCRLMSKNMSLKKLCHDIDHVVTFIVVNIVLCSLVVIWTR